MQKETHCLIVVRMVGTWSQIISSENEVSLLRVHSFLSLFLGSSGRHGASRHTGGRGLLRTEVSYELQRCRCFSFGGICRACEAVPMGMVLAIGNERACERPALRMSRGDSASQD